MDLKNEQIFNRLWNECNIYFESSLISKESLLRSYSSFITSQFDNDEAHSLAISQCPSSNCFDVVSLLTVAIQCLVKGQQDNFQVLSSLECGTYVFYKGKERCIWDGFTDENHVPTNRCELAVFARLIQPDKGNLSQEVLQDNWGHIIPYNGVSTRTDGRGIRRAKTNRDDFVSFLFDIPKRSFPDMTDTSSVIIAGKEMFEKIYKGTKIKFGDEKIINFSDIVTASYFTSNLRESQCGSNPSKNEAILKVTSNISAARELILDKSGNRTLGLLVTDITARGDNSELFDLLERKSLDFSILSSSMESELAKQVIKAHEEAPIFVCTKKFLERNYVPSSVVNNDKTLELAQKVQNILRFDFSAVSVDSNIISEKIQTLRSLLNAICQSDVNATDKDEFIFTAYSLIKVFLTAPFSLEKANEFSRSSLIRVLSPEMKLRKLEDIAKHSEELTEQFSTIVKIINGLYFELLGSCPKQNVLFELLRELSNKKVVIVVPKAYYEKILSPELKKFTRSLIVTANQFDNSKICDVVISVGEITGKNFNLFNCYSAKQIYVLLYDGEKKLFKYKKRVSENYEEMLNTRLGLNDNSLESEVLKDSEDVASLVQQSSNLEKYIKRISEFNIHSFAKIAKLNSNNTSETEVYAVGQFVTGERIFFTKYYQSVSLNESNKSVVEKSVESLSIGDRLIFVKRDENTKNMVDYIYDQLSITGKFSKEIIEATYKSRYWKKVLRDYKELHHLTNRELAKQLHSLGLKTQEASIWQWLIGDSRIIEPREENTIEKIATLTKDTILLESVHDTLVACKTVRKQRVRILKLIGKAVEEKASGITSDGDVLMKFILESVESLSKILELEEINILDESVSLPANLMNKPITETEIEI